MRISDWSSDVCSSDLQDRGVFKVDVAYQTSRSVTENFNAEVGQRVPTVFVEFDDNNGPSFTLDPSIPLSSENVSLRNSINQNFSAGEGSLFQARMDSEYELDGVLTKLRGGLRYAKREENGRASCRERVCQYV